MTFYPPTAFHFRVVLLDSDGLPGLASLFDGSFQDVSGIEARLGTEDVPEGGENRFVHRLPVRAAYSNLVLKRGILTTGSPLAHWVETSIGNNLARPIKPRDLLVMLLDKSRLPLVTWHFTHAYPVRWETSSLNSTESSVLTETLELAYHRFERTVIPPFVLDAISAGAGAVASAVTGG